MKLSLLNWARIAMLLAFVFIAVTLRSQSTAGGNIDSPFALPHTPKDNTVLPSPEPAQLNRYSDYPVSYCTGVPDISIPLYGFTEGDLSLSLSFSYHASGIKVEDIAGFVGLGWSLQGGGSISRVIRGQPDEKKKFELQTSAEIERNADLAYLQDLQDLNKEANYDRYYYRFGTCSGSFIYDVNNRSVTELPKTDNRIELFNYVDKSNFDFKVITPDGTSYYFTEREHTNYQYTPSTLSVLFRNPSYTGVTTSWHLSRIVSFNKADTIHLSYGKIPSWSRTTNYNYRSCTGTRSVSTPTYSESCSEGYLAAQHLSTFTDTRIPSYIRFRDGYIRFYTASVGLKSPIGNPGQRIERIEVYNRDNKLIRTVSLQNAGGFGDGRMMLSGLTIREEGEVVDTYNFQYYNPTTRVTENFDAFGYYNGKSRGRYSLLNEREEWEEGRSYDFACARTYNLSSITCSTGGKTEFTYEPNVHTVIISGKSVPIHIGMRIKTINLHDPATGIEKIRDFTYEKSGTNIDFSRLVKGMYISQSGCGSYAMVVSPISGTFFGRTSLSQTNTFTSTCRLPGNPVENAVTYYGRVTETIHDGNGVDEQRVVYEYNTGNFPDPLGYSSLQRPSLPLSNQTERERFIGYGVGEFILPYKPMYTPYLPTFYFKESFLPKTELTGKYIYRKREGRFELAEEERRMYSVHDQQEVTTGFYLENLIYLNNEMGHMVYRYKNIYDFNFFEVTTRTGRSVLDSTYTVRYFPGYPSQRSSTSYVYNKYAPVNISGGGILFPMSGSLMPSLIQAMDTLISRPANLLPQSVKTQAGGNTYERRFYYSSSISRPFFISMTSAGNISAPVMEQLIINGIDTVSLHTAYGKYGTAILPRQYTELHNRDTLSYRLCDYDALGNLVETSSNGLAPTSYFWGSSRACPIWMVEGIGSRQASQWSASYAIRNSLPPTVAHATDFNHIPLVGLGAITSPSQREQRFEYSGTRLSGALDGYKNPICRYTFHYATSSSDANYVRTMAYLSAGGGQFLDSYLYFDGLGQPYQLVQPAFTPLGNTLATQTQYDAFGREKRKWLPVPVAGSTSLAPVADLATQASTYYGDAIPYTENQYECSVRNLIQAVEGPGTSFAGHPAETAYMTNTTTSGGLFCMHFRLVNNQTLCRTKDYAPGDLQVILSTDGDGNKTYTFTDEAGRTVLSRCMNGTAAHDTYTVYDNLGRKCFVLPPSAADVLTAMNTNWSIQSNATLKNYAYFYRYNAKSHLVEKKLPGAEPVYYLYDKAGQCIFSQDGNQRSLGQWTFTIPDLFSRMALTGYYTGANPEPGIRTKVVCATFDKSQAGIGNTGYTVPDIFPTGSATVLKANYYDTYEFLEKYPAEKAELGYASLPGYDEHYTGYPIKIPSGGPSFMPFQLYPTPHAGMLTGSCTALLSGDLSRKIVSAFYYDDKGRIVQQLETNHLAGYEKEYYSYTFTGKPTKKLHKHSVPGKASRTELYAYTYDRAERLLKVTHQLDGGATVVLAENTYDELGRLKNKKNHGNTSLKTDYTYNIRSWLTAVSSPKFTQTMVYETDRRYFNGNISSMSWKVGSESFTRKYTYSYDGLDRLVAANYTQSSGLNGIYTTNYSYNKMGSITRLQRRGLAGEADRYGIIDDLFLFYSGNQLKSVTDASGISDPLYNNSFNFVDGADENVEYGYDKNGNLAYDLNKKISDIQYNQLNLPATVSFEGDKWVNYAYDAGGVRRSRRDSWTLTLLPTTPGGIPGRPPGGITPLPKSTTTDYCGSIIYKSGTVDMILTDEGYITLSGTVPVYHYYQKDYQGNNRMVVKQDGTVEEVNHYYPYGGLFGESALASTQDYKFGGKQIERMHGLNWYDFIGRMQDPLVPGFTTMDPLCEKYYAWTPYGYCMGNPIRFIDPDGREVQIPPILPGLNPVFLGSNPIVTTGRMLSTADKAVKITPKESHHTIPSSLRGNETVKAAKDGGFKINGKENRISVDKFSKATGEGQHGKHPKYTEQIREKLESFGDKKPNMTPKQAAEYIRDLVNQTQNTIKNNPNTKINDLQLDQQIAPVDNTKVAKPVEPIKIEYIDPRVL